MKIKDVEQAVGISAHSIRFYEEMGLIEVKRKQDNRYRDFSEADVKKLKEIKLFRSLGITMEEIRRYDAGELTLEQLMDHQIMELQVQQIDQKLKKQLCEDIKQSKSPLVPYTVARYEEVLSHQREQLPYQEAGKLISEWGSHEGNHKRILFLELALSPIVFLFAYVLVSFLYNLPSTIQTGTVVNQTNWFSLVLALVITIVIMVSDYFIQKHFSGEFYEFREKGIYFINEDSQKHLLQLWKAVMHGDIESCYDVIAYDEIKTLKVWFSMVAKAPVNGGNAYAIYFYLTTIHDEKIRLEPGVFGVSDERLRITAELLKEHAQKVIDPYHILEHLADDRQTFYDYLNDCYYEREQKRLQHRLDAQKQSIL